jgi:uncharacterized protein YndB with AHSA1/START domain
MKIQQSIMIAAPIDQVWCLVDDTNQIRRWVPQIVETTLIGNANAPRHVGQRFTQRIKQGSVERSYQGEITTYQPGQVLGVHIIEPSLTGDVIYRFSPTAGGTQVDFSADIRMGNIFARAASALSGPLIGIGVRKLLERLKRVAETQA